MFQSPPIRQWNAPGAVSMALLLCLASTAQGQAAFDGSRVASRFSLLVAPTYAFPAGDGFEGTDSHLGIRLTGTIPWANRLAFAVTFQYQPLGIASPAEVDIQKYLGGFHYLDDVKQQVTIYGSYDIGAFVTRKVEVLSTGLAESTSTRLGMAGGVGIIYWTSPQIGVDLSARIEQTSFKSNQASASGYLFDLHAGIRVPL